MFASLAVLEVRDGRLGRRPLLAGATRWALPAGSLALVLTAIGATTFDGAQEGVLKEPISSLFQSLSDVGPLAGRGAAAHELAVSRRHPARVAAIFWGGIYGMRIVDGKRSALELGAEVRARVHPDRAGLPRRPLLQPRRLPGAGPVHLPALRPARRRLRSVRHRRDRHRLRADRRDRDLVRPVRGDRRRPCHRSRARPRPRPRPLEGLADGRLLAGLDARDDGLLQRPRPLPALAGERLTCPSRSLMPATGCRTSSPPQSSSWR